MCQPERWTLLQPRIKAYPQGRGHHERVHCRRVDRGMVSNVLNLLNVEPFYQYLGPFFLLAAILLDKLKQDYGSN